MKNKIRDKITLLQYAAYTITIMVLVITNLVNENLWVILLLFAILFFSFLVRNTFLYPLKSKLSTALVFLDFILILELIRLDNGAAAKVFLYLLVSDAALNYRYLYSFLLSILSLAAYLVLLRFTLADSELLTYFIEAVKSSVQFIIVCSFLFILKYILTQNDRIQEALSKLTDKTLEQEVTNRELREAYLKLENITVLKERNKLAREIHDTLGHTLTTVLLEIEAGKILLEKETALGLEKFSLATEQLRKGMEDLRRSVYLLSKGDELIDFKTSLEDFLEETMKHTGVIIEYEIDNVDEIDTSLKKTLFRALQEGITNGIKHGKSSVFVFKLSRKDGNIEFLLQDNGKGCSAIVLGFGLKSMQERIKEASGSMELVSEPSEGFSLSILIPVKKGDQYYEKVTNCHSR